MATGPGGVTSSDRTDAPRVLAVVPTAAPEQTVTVVKGRPPELRAGPGFAIYERRRDGAGGEIEEFITVLPSSEPTLYAVSNDQFNAWKGKRLIAKPVHLSLEER